MIKFVSNVSVVPTWLWIAFTIGVLVLLVIDLCLFGRGNHKIQTKTALIESGIWITVALCFNAWFAMSFGAELGLAKLIDRLCVCCIHACSLQHAAAGCSILLKAARMKDVSTGFISGESSSNVLSLVAANDQQKR